MDCGGRGRGGGDLDYLLPHASILQERGGELAGSVVTSVESKDEMAALNVDIIRINQNYDWSCKTRGQWKQSQSNVRTTISQCSSDSVTMMGKGQNNHYNQ